MREAVYQGALTSPPSTYMPVLVTDVGSAMFGVDSWYRMEPAIGLRISDFVKTLGAAYAVAAYSTSDGRKHESFSLYGTDGFTLKQIEFMVTRKTFGAPSVRLIQDESVVPWESDGFFSTVSRTLREQNDGR
jgi:hypothetical protein